ncbi:MAG TPA: VWA domain-containing protein [bacterium]|nr:VWA domain-containing protein [bacterium]
MTFQWPLMLLGLAALPVLAAVYAWALRRPIRAPVAHTQLALLAQAVTASPPWRRHVPAALAALALAAVLLAMARPVAPLPVPAVQNTVVLSIDVSRSMLADDIPPSRIEAAKTAAREFVRAVPRGLKVGLVSFSSYATLIIPPTADRQRVLEAIDLLSTEFATAIGDGLLEAVWALPGRQRPSPGASPAPPQPPVPPGTVVLLSDGQSNRGTIPQDAARVAREQDVKVYTIGVGTPEGTFLSLGGRSIWVRLDEATLQEIAEVTGGRYFHATSASELRRVYRQLSRTIGWEARPTEVSALAAGAAALFLVVAVGVSLLGVHRL